MVRARPRGAALGLALVWLAALCGLALAQGAPAFPGLSGRVVDEARLLQPAERDALTERLRAHEERTTDQVVVVTVPFLQGLAVEDYANRLFRTWALGQKGKNNGVLLLVAPSERKVRIEVGYGLEGALTDAVSKVVIATGIAPRFKAGDYAGGIGAGVEAILSVLTGDAQDWQRRAEIRNDETGAIDPAVAAIVVIVILVLLFRMLRGGGGRGSAHRTRAGRWIVLPGPGPGSWGGGVSGGGGSSGGGGASGDW